MTISVFLLDDHEIVRRGLADLLEAEDDIVVVGEAATAAQALTQVPALLPDVAVLEIGRASCREKCRSRWSPYH